MEALNLKGCRVTDAGLLHLKFMNNLKKSDLSKTFGDPILHHQTSKSSAEPDDQSGFPVAKELFIKQLQKIDWVLPLKRMLLSSYLKLIWEFF